MWQLYKYHPLNKNHLSNLAQRKLWAADPAGFNDPFEFRLQRTSEVIGLSEVRMQNPHLVDWTDAQLINLTIELYQNTLNKMGVVCYSEEPDDILLWSHYTDNHTGICLGFCGNDESETPSDVAIYPVKYQESYPGVDFKNVWHEDGLARILKTKHTAWSYEKEWRTIVMGGNRHIDYSGKLNKIIFGLRTSEADQNLVRSLVGDDTNVEFIKVVQDPKYYKLLVMNN